MEGIYTVRKKDDVYSGIKLNLIFWLYTEINLLPKGSKTSLYRKIIRIYTKAALFA
jgi:hypothetical protein